MAESGEEIIYVVDASSWISIEGNPDANRILSYLDMLAEKGRIKCPPQCLSEVRSKYMAGWIKGRRKQISHSLRSNVGFLKKLGEVTQKHPAMSGAFGTREKADPYVVAYAAYRNANENPTKCIVVSNESALVRPNRKIPTACRSFDVEHLSLSEMLKREFPEENW